MPSSTDPNNANRKESAQSDNAQNMLYEAQRRADTTKPVCPTCEWTQERYQEYVKDVAGRKRLMHIRCPDSFHGTGNVEGSEPAKRVRCTEHQGLPENVLLGCLACANAASAPNMAWKPCTACNERFPVGQEPTHCAECHQPLHDTQECRDKHTQERHHRAPTKTTPNVRDINVPKTTGSAELDAIFARQVDEIFKHIASMVPEVWREKILETGGPELIQQHFVAHTARQIEAAEYHAMDVTVRDFEQCRDFEAVQDMIQLKRARIARLSPDTEQGEVSR
jgi:hypothetical protein